MDVIRSIDITYIPTGEGWLYLTTVLDLADRKVIGWALSDTLRAGDRSVAAWRMAFKNRPIAGELLSSPGNGIAGEDDQSSMMLRVVDSVLVSTFTLVNAATNQDFREIKDGDVIDLATLPSGQLNIRALTTPLRVGSVVFALSGAKTYTRTENGPPYALFGDIGGNYIGSSLKEGEYTLTATPYRAAKGTGKEGIPLTIHFNVVYSARVSGFTLVNADTDQDITELKEGDVIDLSTLAGAKLNIRANTDSAKVGSMAFKLQGPQTYRRIENGPPYALFGDIGGDYFNGTLQAGAYTLTASPYSASKGMGAAGTSNTITFKVVDSLPDVVDLRLEHTVYGDDAVALKGEAVDVIIRLINDGPRPAHSIKVQLDKPSGCTQPDTAIRFDGIILQQDIQNSYHDNDGIWEIAALNPKEEIWLTFAGVKRSDAGTVYSRAEVKDGSSNDPTPENNKSYIYIDYINEEQENSGDADLQMGITAPGEIEEETIHPVDINVMNKGPRTANGVVLEYAVTAQGEGEEPVVISGPFTQSFENLGSGCSATINFDVELNRPGTITIEAKMTSSNGSDNESKTITVTPRPGSSASAQTANARSRSVNMENGMNEGSAGLILYPSYPDPFKISTTVSFQLEKESLVQLSILNLYGLLIDNLLHKSMPAGKHQVLWQAKHLTSGVYIVQLSAGNVMKAQRIVLIR